MLTRPDVIAGSTAPSSRSAPTWSRPTPSAPSPCPLGEYDIAERAHEINVANARIAREVADDFATPDRPRFVAGSIGPGTKFASLGQIRFAELRDAYEVQAAGLLEGGVDLLIIETQFDLLGLKAAVIGARRAMAAVGREVPIQVQVTIELTGRMLPGTEIGAALAAIDPLRRDVIGLNCATGPAEMSEHLRHLSPARAHADLLPAQRRPAVGGRRQDALRPHARAAGRVPRAGSSPSSACRWSAAAAAPRPSYIGRWSTTLPRPHARPPRTPVHEPAATSIYTPVPFEQDTSFLMIGERTNANGSKKFREAMLEGDWDTCAQMASDQVKEGAHVLDVCVDYVGRDGTVDMDEIASRFATQADAPLVLDSTEPQVMEAGLQWIGGRAILNSANLEDGEAPGSRLDRVFTLAQHYGAAVICLLIDEEGQARDVEWKMRVAHRIDDLAVEPLRPRAGRPHLRRPHLPALHRRRRPAPRRHRHHGGHPPHQGRDPRRLHHARPLQRVVRPQAGRPPRPQLGVPARVRRGRPRLGHRPRREDHAAQPHPRRAARGLPRPRLRPAGHRRRAVRRRRRLRPAAEAARRLRRREGGSAVEQEDRIGLAGRAAAQRSASSTATATASRTTSTRRWPRAPRRSTSSTTCCSPA